MSDIAFSDITEEFGREYKVYLKRYKNFGASQTNHCLCWLNRLVYLAVDHEIIRANPLEEVEYEEATCQAYAYQQSGVETTAGTETPRQ